MIGIYKITNLKTKKVYIGQSTNVIARWNQHLHQVISTPLLDKEDWHWDLYNHPEDYNFQILELCSKEEMNIKEADYIEKENSIVKGLNKNFGILVSCVEKIDVENFKKEEKEKEVNNQFNIVIKKYLNIPLIGEIQSFLIDDCKSFLRNKEGEKDFTINLILKKARTLGYEVKRGKIGKKHINQGYSESDLGKNFMFIANKI